MITNYYTKTIVLQKPTETNGDFGQLKKSFSTALTFKGEIENQNGARVLSGSKYETFEELILFCDVIADIKTSYRILYNNLYYRIINIANIKGHHMEINLQLIEGDSY